jgi:hypothetical protein
MASDSNVSGVVAVNREGILGFVISGNSDLRAYLGVTADGSPWQSDAPVILGRLNDWLASGESFPRWVRQRGFHGAVANGAGDAFLDAATRVGVC